MHLTKSDFILARTCPTKLYYKKLRYPSMADDDPYLEFLRDGGYMVETMAKLLFPEGCESSYARGPEVAAEETERALRAGDATLFQATVIHDDMLVVVDILCRQGSTLRLIEVKSSSVDSCADGPNPFRGKRGGILSKNRHYLEDVAFQAMVLRRAFPEFTVVPQLCMVDKAKAATSNATFDKFRLLRAEDDQGHFRPEVKYSGDVGRLKDEHVLVILDVSEEVEELETDITSSADELVATLQEDAPTRTPPEIGAQCKKCEFRIATDEGQQNGFRECWRGLADQEPHILDLYRVDLLGGKDRDLVAELAAEGKAGLLDVPKGILSGASGARQSRQIEYTEQGREFIDRQLGDILLGHPYPLHFIDFETSTTAIPYHENMHPYERTAFQWSCHTIQAPRAELGHAEWLNTEGVSPNYAFAQTLRQQIGDEGTVYIWTHYERTVLKTIRAQMEEYGHEDGELAAWIDELTVSGNNRLVDLCELAKHYYYHPMMKGSASIKYVLPAVWQEGEDLREAPEFAQYVKYDDDGHLLDPYASLPPFPIGDKEEVVNEGTGAMRVYQEMLFGLAKGDPLKQESYRKLLLQYCELDTAAMVMIWRHWSKS